MTEFNVNDHVWVKLTELGHETYLKHWKPFVTPGSELPRPFEVDGWCRFQLWELMHIYGAHIGNGFKMQFEYTIRLSEPVVAETGEKEAGMDIGMQRARRVVAGLVDNYLLSVDFPLTEGECAGLREIATSLLEENVLSTSGGLAGAVKRAREACGCHGCASSVRPYSNQFAVVDPVARPSQCLATVLLRSELK